MESGGWFGEGENVMLAEEEHGMHILYSDYTVFLS